MKKLLLSVLALFLLISLRADIIEKTYSFDDHKIVQKGDYHLIQFDNTLLTGVAGEPVLPYKDISLLLPPGHIAVSIEIIPSQLVEIEGNYTLYPQQHSQPLSKGKSGMFVKNESLYLSAEDYPLSYHGNLETQYMNGYSFAFSTFTPVVYNPGSGKLSYYKNITVKIESAPGDEASIALQLLNSTPHVKNSVKQLAHNPESIKSYPEKIIRDEAYEILIITDESYVESFNDLISLYMARGYKSEIISVDEIYTTINGQDIQERIRNYIIQEYTENSIEFVLLGGDIAFVPYRGFYCTVQSSSVYEDDDIPSDLYYSALDGTWNDNGNNRWGEIGEDDLLPEVAVGRMPFSTPEELNNMLNKDLSYQDAPVEGELNRPLLAGEHLWADPETWGADYLDLLIGYHEDNGYTTNGIPEGDDWETLYEKNASWNGATLREKINSGKAFVHHVGHANATYVMHLNQGDITNSNFSGANGIDHNFTIVYTHGCICGSFDYNDCIAETMVTIENFAAAFVGNSRYGWFNEGQTEGPSQHLHREFVDAIYTDKLNRIGRAHMESRTETAPWVNAPGQHEEGALRWCFYDCNVLGDPMMAIWTDNPIDIQVDFQSALPIGITSTNVFVSSQGTPVEGFRCAIIHDSQLIGTGITNSDGDAIVEFYNGLSELGDASLVVSGYNCLPSVNPVTIIPNGGAYVIYESNQVNDVSGNNNGLIDFGEAIQLSLGITNVGEQIASNLTILLSTNDEYITITDNSEALDQLPGGHSTTLENAFAFEVADNIPDQHMIYFQVEVSADDNWSSDFSLTANAPLLAIGSILVDDSESGNNDGKLDPGESATIIINTSNNGHSSCFDVLGTISSSNQHLTIHNNTFEVDQLNAGAFANASFDVTIGEAAPIGTIVNLNYEVNSGEYNAESVFNLTVGIIDEDFETADFTEFEWLFSGDLPWGICDTESWEGQYCAMSGQIGDQASSEMALTMEVLIDDTISFYRKVSSEAGYDYLQFYVDETMEGEWAGEMGWERIVVPVTAGNHTFKWVYKKDVYVSSGEDRAWVDYIVFPPVYLPVQIQDQIISGSSVYPNPFTESLKLSFYLEEESDVTIELFSQTGQLIMSEDLHKKQTGNNEYILKQDGLTPGYYFLQIRADQHKIVHRIILTK